MLGQTPVRFAHVASPNSSNPAVAPTSFVLNHWQRHTSLLRPYNDSAGPLIALTSFITNHIHHPHPSSTNNGYRAVSSLCSRCRAAVNSRGRSEAVKWLQVRANALVVVPKK